MELEPTPTVFGCWRHALPRLMCKLGFGAVPKRDSELHLNSRNLKMRNSLGVMPNVRAKRVTTAGRQARAGENVPRTARPGLVACRWRSA